ncbi:MAG: hypothetical protein KatS3mg057_0051 [Herpetosiphonaceae bacterium]|nr:MAG: hypothetical protein KatS3mg057_0051 [Herpetosiphonaceae bacterium]
MQLNNPWFTFVRPNPDAKVRLFCFHYAGGRSIVFRRWQSMLPDAIQVFPVELPGRGGRLRENPFRSLGPLIEVLQNVLVPHLDRPFAFFGHSMGGLISFELARALRRAGYLLPVHLFISAHRAPHLPNPDSSTYDLPDEKLIEKIRSIEGTPPEVLAHPELLELILPILRADFEICDTYAYTAAQPLDCPITVFGGTDDRVVSPDLLPGWAEHTTRLFELRTFPGNHFFIQEAERQVLEIIGERLVQTLRAG